MIDIYTIKKDSKDWIIYNDLYFNLNTANEEMTEKDIAIIKRADDAILTQDKHIQTKYGLGTIRNLSSGCKTLLNIIKYPEKVVCVEECGPKDAKLRFNDCEIVTGNIGYNAWWSKEYERREKDDI